MGLMKDLFYGNKAGKAIPISSTSGSESDWRRPPRRWATNSSEDMLTNYEILTNRITKKTPNYAQDLEMDTFKQKYCKHRDHYDVVEYDKTRRRGQEPRLCRHERNDLENESFDRSDFGKTCIVKCNIKRRSKPRDSNQENADLPSKKTLAKNKLKYLTKNSTSIDSLQDYPTKEDGRPGKENTYPIVGFTKSNTSIESEIVFIPIVFYLKNQEEQNKLREQRYKEGTLVKENKTGSFQKEELISNTVFDGKESKYSNQGRNSIPSRTSKNGTSNKTNLAADDTISERETKNRERTADVPLVYRDISSNGSHPSTISLPQPTITDSSSQQLNNLYQDTFRSSQQNEPLSCVLETDKYINSSNSQKEPKRASETTDLENVNSNRHSSNSGNRYNQLMNINNYISNNGQLADQPYNFDGNSMSRNSRKTSSDNETEVKTSNKPETASEKLKQDTMLQPSGSYPNTERAGFVTTVSDSEDKVEAEQTESQVGDGTLSAESKPKFQNLKSFIRDGEVMSLVGQFVMEGCHMLLGTSVHSIVMDGITAFGVVKEKISKEPPNEEEINEETL